MFGPRVSVDPDIQSDARAGRCVPTNRLTKAHGHGDERVDGSAVRARRHAAWVARPFAPQRRRGRRLARRGTLATTLCGKLFAHAVGCFHRRGVEQQYRRDGKDLEEGSHEGEVKVYCSDERLQEVPKEKTPAGGETEGG